MTLRTTRPRWPSAMGRLLAAQALVGAGIALAIRSDLGAAPWDVLHTGLHRATGASIGAVTLATGIAAVALALAGGVRPGPATAVSALALGGFADAALALAPAAPSPALGAAWLAASLALTALGTGLFLSAGRGAAPRDSLMLALARRGVPLHRARAALELGAVGAGAALGGQVGAGTLIYAVAIGPLVQRGVAMFEASR